MTVERPGNVRLFPARTQERSPVHVYVLMHTCMCVIDIINLEGI